ncbi:cell wall hydrolase [Sphingobium sp.]|uniref:cell wall hydrolase n=1 Tax=Sphingobium sp. TaxID=1912891 RepID=UPI003B3AF319
MHVKSINPVTLLSWIVWALLFVGLPMAVAGWESRRQADTPDRMAAVDAVRNRKPSTPPPAVDPVRVYALERDQAVAFNQAVPFSRDPNPAARPFLFSGTETDLARAIDCLAAAEIYEAGDDAVGEQAVAQVVLNRVRHPAFPKSVCGVVFQGQERQTGCQFTFSCDGALARMPGPAAWARAQDIARGALAGKVYAPVGHATHYHTDWVVPYWSASLDKITAVGTHLFFRWRGWWGTPAAFRRSVDPGEPLIAKIARFSIAHRDAGLPLPGAITPVGDSAEAIAAQARQAIGLDQIGKTVAGVRLIALADIRSFIVELPKGSKADSWPESARTFCAGRPQCRIMGWIAADAPKELPLTLANLAAMRFSYMHDVQSGLQRALWNCAITPRAAKNECMRQRVPVVVPADTGTNIGADTGLAGVRRKDRFETVKIVPPVAPMTPVAPASANP